MFQNCLLSQSIEYSETNKVGIGIDASSRKTRKAAGKE